VFSDSLLIAHFIAYSTAVALSVTKKKRFRRVSVEDHDDSGEKIIMEMEKPQKSMNNPS
jgi:hypothetical protein